MTGRLKFLLLLLTCLLVGLLVLLVPPARAHTEQGYPPPTYCGHSEVQFWVAMPNGNVQHREAWQGGYTSSGVHRHDYRVWRLATNPTRWVIVHYHYGRVCPGHPV